MTHRSILFCDPAGHELCRHRDHLLVSGCEVRSHTDVETALADDAAGVCDVAIIAMTGTITAPSATVAVTARLRANATTNHLPVLLLGNITAAEAAPVVQATGIAAYVGLPCFPEQLRQRIESVCQQARDRRDRSAALRAAAERYRRRAASDAHTMGE